MDQRFIHTNLNNQSGQPIRGGFMITPEKPKKKFSLIFYIVVFTVFLSLGALGFYYFKNQQSSKDPKNTEIEKVIKSVSKLILLPIGEEPTVATVSDPEKVRNQPFFTNSVAGDKLLIYLQARKAYLYRPSEDKLVEVAPLTPENSVLNSSSSQN